MKPSIQGPLDALSARISALEAKIADLTVRLPATATALSGTIRATAASLSGTISAAVGHSLGMFDVRAFGAKGDGVTDDTAAIQLALDTAGIYSGTVFVPASGYPFRFSNLKMSAHTKLMGSYMLHSQLQRIPGSTGTAITEKTPAEGNAYGATGIWIQDLYVDGNNTSGDGINLGNRSSYQFSSLSGLQNVAAWYFPSGSGINVNSNASSFMYLWADHCATGIYVGGGGANTFHSLFAEFNSKLQIEVAESDDTFHGIQIETMTGQSSSALISVEGMQNNFYGIYFGLGDNAGTLISNKSGANRNAYYGITVAGGGKTWVDTIRHEVWDTGRTGASGSIHAYVISEDPGAGDSGNWFINGSTGRRSFVTADRTRIEGSLQVIGTTNAVYPVTISLTESAAGATSTNDHRALDVQSYGTISAANQNAIGVFSRLGTTATAGNSIAYQMALYSEADGDTSVSQSIGAYGYSVGGLLNIGTVGDHDGPGYGLLARGGIAAFSDYTWNVVPPVSLSASASTGYVKLGAVIWTTGIGVPNGVVTAPVGSLYSRLDGGATSSLYVKESGVGNLGWIPK